MASNPPTSGPGQPWPGASSDTPGTGTPTPQSPWGQQPQGQWGQPQGQWGQQPQGQWGQQQPQGQWPPRAGQQQPQQPQGQWGQQPQQQGQWGQQPQQQWQQPQQQWGQQPQGQWQQPQQQWGQQQWQQPQQQWGQQQAGVNQWAPAVGAGWGDPEAAFGQDDYPVRVTFTPEAPIGRYWGILWIGMMVRSLLLIPHFILLVFVGLLAYLTTFLTWIPVLLTGRYPGWGYTLVGGLLRWYLRVAAWLYLMSGTYPPFTGADREDQHVRVVFDQARPVGRFWGIPLVGILIRAILLIPHFIVLWLLGFVAWILILFAWVPVLFQGRQADLVYNVVGGWMRWGARVGAYLALMSGPYPPFRLD